MFPTAKDEQTSRIRPQLSSGPVVTTSKNNVHYVVIEYGAVNLKGKSIAKRTKALISIAHIRYLNHLHPYKMQPERHHQGWSSEGTYP